MLVQRGIIICRWPDVHSKTHLQLQKELMRTPITATAVLPTVVFSLIYPRFIICEHVEKKSSKKK
jgi:hypothetical protein